MARGGSGTHGRISDTVNLKQLMLGSTFDNVAGTFSGTGVVMADVRAVYRSSRTSTHTGAKRAKHRNLFPFRNIHVILSRARARDKRSARECLMLVTGLEEPMPTKVESPSTSHYLELSLYPGPPSTATPLQSNGLVIIGP